MTLTAAVITFPGSNRDGDVADAITLAGGRVHRAWHGDHDLPRGTDLVVLPGGFSYGDYLRCGAIAARRQHHGRGARPCRVRRAGARDLQRLPDCLRGRLLPGVLMRNAGLRFICKRQHLKVERNDTAFTSHYAAGQAIDVCIAHGEGNYACDGETLKSSKAKGSSPSAIAMRRAGSAARPIPTARSTTSPASTPPIAVCSA